jgi:hypothetical protein
MIRQFRMCILGICMAACTASKAQRIEVLSANPTLADIIPQCEFTDLEFVVRVQASCVVDSEKRIVVKNFQTDEVLIDTNVTKTTLPNFPKEPGVQPILLPCDRERLEKAKHHLLVSLSGKCGREHATGSTECVTKKAWE